MSTLRPPVRRALRTGDANRMGFLPTTARASGAGGLEQHGAVVLPGVDVHAEPGPATGTSATSAACRSSSFQTPLSPCSADRGRRTSTARRPAGARGRRRSRQTASGASPRPASSAATVSARTPGWSPSISTSTSQPRSRRRPRRRRSTTSSPRRTADSPPPPRSTRSTAAPHALGPPPTHAQQLVEPASAGHAQHVLRAAAGPGRAAAAWAGPAARSRRPPVRGRSRTRLSRRHGPRRAGRRTPAGSGRSRSRRRCRPPPAAGSTR